MWGLGQLLERLTGWLSIRPCQSCMERARKLDQVLIVSVGHPGPAGSQAATGTADWTDSSGCWHFAGACTGFGRTRCVTAPSSQSDPTALPVEQCCGGWFQYPWILVCPDGQVQRGCGFCVA